MLGIAVFNRHSHFQTSTSESTVLIGSQELDGVGVVVEDSLISPRHIRLEADSSKPNFVKLTNLGASIALHSGTRIHRNKTVELPLPAFMCVGDSHVQIFGVDASHSLDRELVELETAGAGRGLESVVHQPGKAPSGLKLAAWFESLSRLQNSIVGSQQFFSEAARAIFNPGGLDGGFVLQRSNDGWKIVASHIPYPEFGISYRRDIVDRVADTRTAVYHGTSKQNREIVTNDVHCCVAVPVLDHNNEIDAVIYGFRSLHRTNNRNGIRVLEAQFVQLVADSVGNAMRKMQSEANAARTRVLLEQAFAPEVARQLELSPEILEGREREVTILFADLRDFSSIAERIGTQQTYVLLTEVMDRFSKIITKYGGVINDFYGDGVSAFWNAPLDQPNHALYACQAAMEMVEIIPMLDQQWQTSIGMPLRVGVGLHTGITQVGNSGSTKRLKYGPRGTAVNITSRLESATKLVGIPILVSGATINHIAEHFHCRKICSTFLRGIKTPIELFQIVDLENTLATQNWPQYADALDLFEQGKFLRAIEILTELQIEDGTDTVVEFMLQQSLQKNDPLGTNGQLAQPLVLTAICNKEKSKPTETARLKRNRSIDTNSKSFD